MSTPEIAANLPDAPAPFKVMALYKFCDLPDAAAIVPALAKFCCGHGIRGTLLLAPEGINGTVAGRPDAIAALKAYLFEDPLFAGRIAGAEVKFADAGDMPFHRLKVRLKDEIITLRAPEANPALQVGTYVEPADWNALIARNDVVLVDTRNAYEVGLGTFERALNPETASFTEFKAFVSTHLDPQRDRKIAMFCTGGIRCEKASSYLLSQGFDSVFHLKGGILNYLETVRESESRWQGECFVFDERVAVGHGLAQGTATLCRACRHPLTETDRADARFEDGIACSYCAEDGPKHEAARERQRQMDLARARGAAHLGDAARAAAERERSEKQARRAADRQRSADKACSSS